jgi:hypothetical protein
MRVICRRSGVAAQAEKVTASSPQYTFARSPLTKAVTVIPNRWAKSTARLDGAETATMCRIPATAAFCTISNPRRPEITKTHSGKGSRRFNPAQPTSLSTALCRPTSSRTTRAAPDRSNRPAPCKPPVSENRAWCWRRESGR